MRDIEKVYATQGAIQKALKNAEKRLADADKKREEANCEIESLKAQMETLEKLEKDNKGGLFEAFMSNYKGDKSLLSKKNFKEYLSRSWNEELVAEIFRAGSEG